MTSSRWNLLSDEKVMGPARSCRGRTETNWTGPVAAWPVRFGTLKHRARRGRKYRYDGVRLAVAARRLTGTDSSRKNSTGWVRPRLLQQLDNNEEHTDGSPFPAMEEVACILIAGWVRTGNMCISQDLDDRHPPQGLRLQSWTTRTANRLGHSRPKWQLHGHQAGPDWNPRGWRRNSIAIKHQYGVTSSHGSTRRAWGDHLSAATTATAR